jgi:hypothetical protein
VRQPRRRFTEHKNTEAGYAARSKGSLKGPFCPRPGFQRTVEGRALGWFPKGDRRQKLRQKLRQIVCRKGSENVTLLRLIL